MNIKGLGKRYWDNLSGKAIKQLKLEKANSIAHMDSLKKQILDYNGQLKKHSELAKHYTKAGEEFKVLNSSESRKKADEIFRKASLHNNAKNEVMKNLKDVEEQLYNAKINHTLENYDKSIKKARINQGILGAGTVGVGALGIGVPTGFAIKHHREKQANIYTDAIEKVAKRILDEEHLRSTVHDELSHIGKGIVSPEKTETRIEKTLSLPWNENYNIFTDLKDKDGNLMTEQFYEPGTDGSVISTVSRKGIPFSNKTRELIMIPNEIRLKDQYKHKGIGSEAYFGIENAGRRLGADRLELAPDEDGNTVWVKDKYGLSIGKSNKREFLLDAKMWDLKHGTKNAKSKSLKLSDYDPQMVKSYMKTHWPVFLEKDLKKG